MSSIGSARTTPGTAVALATAITFVAAVGAAAETQLLRFPDVHGDRVVFVHAEDIWTAPTRGGSALRLTDDEGEERHPKFSPDGSLIGFTAEIDGNPDVYVMSATGGDIRRLTYHPGRDEVVGWHPTKNKIMFRSARHSFGRRFDRLFLISPDGTDLEELPLHEAARGSFSPDGSQIVYNRVAREDRTWKRYFGGMAQDLWLYDFASHVDRRITDYRGTERLPMWIGGSIYFASDRDGPINIYSYDVATGDIAKITDHADVDVRRPSHGGTQIVYEVGGQLWLLDIFDRTTRKIPIDIPSDPRESRHYLRNVADAITEIGISPVGGRALVVARGDVFTVPRQHGPTRNLTRSSDSRDRNAAWSPDGSTIAFLSDRTGEYQLYLMDAKGAAEPRQVGDRTGGYPHTLRWSPDGTRIAFTDETLRLYHIDVATGELATVDQAEVEPMDVSLEAKPISDFQWSPDGRWLAYSKIGPDYVSNIWLYSLDTGKRHNVSSGLFNDFGPTFTRDGEHLLFVSNRRIDPTFCDFEWEMVYKDVAGIYSLTLRADGPPLLPPRSDEVAPVIDTEDTGDHTDRQVRVVIDVDGITDRIEALPVDRGNYRQLAAGAETLYFLDASDGDFNRFEYRSLPPRNLVEFSYEERSQRTLAEEVVDFELSADGKHLVFRTDEEEVGILDTEPEHQPNGWKSKAERRKFEAYMLDLGGLEARVDPVAEWRQVYWEAWRLERDYFYDPNMHGLDWQSVGDTYGQLLEGISCAQDLRFLIGELIGELATSHTYIRTGDRRRRAERVNVGMLGADWEVDGDRFRLAKIYRVPHWSKAVFPPLAGTGIDVREGDYLLEVDGVEVTADRSVYAYFQGLADRQVRLAFSDRPSGGTLREVVVTPIADEDTLRYLDWVEHNRRVVDEASGGRIGYLHLPDTYTSSAVEFGTYYYAQTRKQGLLIDGRFNNGGLDPDIFLARLAKQPLAYWTRRYSEDQVTPVFVSTAHMALLTNRQAGSGGDELPHEFRQKGMGPVIGTRTWGGLVGVSMFISLLDGSKLTVPDYRIYTPDGQWTVENEGVTPDIVVELDPAEMARGWDAQLQRGIEYLLDTLASNPVEPSTHPPFPTVR
jgi:tricorn protease